MRTRRCLSFRWQQPIKWFVLSSLFIQVICLKDLRITVPEAVAVGDTVTLSCFYDLENVAFEFHYRVGSYLRRGFYCGGTLITYQHVLVSPQCFSNYIHVCDIVGQKVYGGMIDYDKRNSSRVQIRAVKSFTVHPQFSDYDQAKYALIIITLDSPFNASCYTRPALIVFRDPPIRAKCQLIVWRKKEDDVFSAYYCNKLFGGVVVRGHLRLKVDPNGSTKELGALSAFYFRSWIHEVILSQNENAPMKELIQTVAWRNCSSPVSSILTPSIFNLITVLVLFLFAAALYSVRWYFENEEFYRYVPKEQPPSRVFTISGVPVDIQRSSEHSVIIRSVSRNHSGSYQCEVSADAPLFHTESSTATMLVADLPESEPVISILGMAGPDHKRIVHSHETFKAHCDAGPSHPSVNFTWFVNGIRFPSTHSGLRDVDIQHNTNGLKESWSELVVQVDNHIVSASSRKLIIRCETNIYSLYRGVAESELYVIGDDFWLNGGKVSPTIDQRGNRGDPDNSALTGSALSIHRGIQSLRTSRKNIMKLIESLGLVLILLITVFQL